MRSDSPESCLHLPRCEGSKDRGFLRAEGLRMQAKTSDGGAGRRAGRSNPSGISPMCAYTGVGEASSR